MCPGIYGNDCGAGYVSLPPLYRCSSCAPSFYLLNSKCVRCPDSPAAIFIVFALAVVVGAAAGYILNKKSINIAFLSIGFDFMQVWMPHEKPETFSLHLLFHTLAPVQVMAMLANADIKWPSQVLQLFNILSAFNLNIQIVAPECLIPSVSFSQKFAFIVMLPAVLGFFFVIVHFGYVAYKACIMGRRRDLHRNLAVRRAAWRRGATRS